MLSLVFKKLNICSFMPASRGVNPLATSHTVEHLSGTCLHSCSHDKLILYLICHWLNEIKTLLEPLLTIKKCFLMLHKKEFTSGLILEI